MSSRTICWKCKGFTLVELMVVIVIIGVIGGILFTGATYVFSQQAEKKALGQIEVLQLALEKFRSAHGDYPETDSENEFQRSEFLVKVLYGFVDQEGDDLEYDERGMNMLPADALDLGKMDGGKVVEYVIDSESLLSGKVEDEFFAVDPWNAPYVYQYPRDDGHNGFLLFSKGPDGESSVFDSELTSTPDKQNMDLDNLPSSEPGKW